MRKFKKSLGAIRHQQILNDNFEHQQFFSAVFMKNNNIGRPENFKFFSSFLTSHFLTYFTKIKNNECMNAAASAHRSLHSKVNPISALKPVLLAFLMGASLMLPSLTSANVLNGPQYEVERLGPFDVPNPDHNGAAKCAALPTSVPGGFPYTSRSNLDLVIPGGASAIANATTTRCYPVKMFLYVPKNAPSKARPAAIYVHGGTVASPEPNPVEIDYIRRLVANGIVVAFLDYQPPFQGNPGSASSDWPVPSLRMSGVLDNFLEDAITAGGFAKYGLVAFTADQETVLVAYDWLKDNAATYGIDPNAIGVVASSFGAILTQANYGFSAAGVIPADFKFQIAIRSCYSLPSRVVSLGITSGACTPLSLYENTILTGPPLLAFSGTLDLTFPPPFEDQFVQQLQANRIPVEYLRLKAGHDYYFRYLGGELADRSIQFIYAVTQNEGCIYSHELKNGKSACHLLGFVPEILDNSNASFDSCFNNRVAYGGHTYARCTGYEADQWLVNWDQAKALCQSRGGYLVKVDDAAENSFVQNWAIAENIEDGRGPWIGANEKTMLGSWVWNDETSPFCIGNNPCVPVSGAYTNWNAGNPSTNTANLCGAMNKSTGRWQNTNCTLGAYTFVCEFDQ